MARQTKAQQQEIIDLLSKRCARLVGALHAIVSIDGVPGFLFNLVQETIIEDRHDMYQLKTLNAPGYRAKENA